MLFTIIAALAAAKSKVKEFVETMEKYGQHDGLSSSEPRSAKKARFKAFLQHYREIEDTNHNPENTFKAEANFLSILADERQNYLGRIRNNSFHFVIDVDGSDDSLVAVKRSELPTSRDWRGTTFRIYFSYGIAVPAQIYSGAALKEYRAVI